jgi:hypothetical protein
VAPTTRRVNSARSVNVTSGRHRRTRIPAPSISIVQAQHGGVDLHLIDPRNQGEDRGCPAYNPGRPDPSVAGDCRPWPARRVS